MFKRKLDSTNRADTSKKQKCSGVVDLEEIYLMPSLQHVSMSKVAVTLWNQADIKNEIGKYFSECEYLSPNECHRSSHIPYGDKFRQIVHKVLENLLELALPMHVREMLANIVLPIGSEIFVWIKYQDEYVFHNPEFREEKSIAINYIDDLVWTPRGKIDYKETAKTLLAKGGILCDLHKYNIACEYCLEDDIAIIAPKVINSTLILESIYRQAMLFFWTAHITGDYTELNEEVSFYNMENYTNYSTHECLFKVLIDNSPHEVAIKYIWDKLSPEEQSRQIAPAMESTSNNDVLFFLLSQITKEQAKELFKEGDASKILKHILGDWLWGHCFLPTVHNIGHIMSGCDYFDVLQGIMCKMENSHEDIAKYNEYKAIFKEVWRWAPKHLKDYVFDESRSLNNYMFFRLFDKKNKDIIKSILLDLNDVQKKAIIFSGSGIFGLPLCFQNLITSNQMDFLDWLIERTLFCREDIERFKQRLVSEFGQVIAVHFIRNKEWSKVQQFLKWALISENDIRVFKLNIVYTSEICPDILKSIVKSNNVDFTELEYFFEWCTSGSAEGVIELKKNMLEQRYCFDTVICKLIHEDKYEFLEQILSWCFVYDQKQVAQFKQSFCQDDQICKRMDSIVHLIKQDDQLQSLKKYVYYCCATDEEINKFKTCILHPKEGTVGACEKLLGINKFKLADELLIWCCDSSQIQINKFKNQLLIDDRINGFSLRCYNREVIRWFNLSIETMITLKENFRSHWSFKYILPVLDKYAQEQLKIEL